MILPKADCKLERRQLNYGRRLFSFVRIMILFSVCFNFCLPSLSKNHIIYWEKACQFSKTSKKVCPKRVDRAEEPRKGHTRESKKREKYAPSALAEQKNHEKDIPGKASKVKSMPRARCQSGKITKRAYQRKQEGGKVCPKCVGRAEESQKGHTGESQ